MNYKESKKIKRIIDSKDSFLLICHEAPDQDSVLSCLSFGSVLKDLNKNVEIVSKDNLGPANEKYDLDNNIKIVDSNELDYSKYEVLLALDVNEYHRLGLPNDFSFNGTVINIDHHEDGGIGDIIINETRAGSTCTILYHLFRDLKYNLTDSQLNMLLLGVMADTDIFRFSVSEYIFETVISLMNDGADYNQALFLLEQSDPVQKYQFLAEGIETIKIDRKNKFAYAIVPYDVYKKYRNYGVRSRDLSDGYLRNIIGTNFGIVIMEGENGEAKVSVRTRTPGYYVLDLVKRLGGGGHLTGGGALVEESTFEKSVLRVLKEARKFAKEHN